MLINLTKKEINLILDAIEMGSTGRLKTTTKKFQEIKIVFKKLEYSLEKKDESK